MAGRRTTGRASSAVPRGAGWRSTRTQWYLHLFSPAQADWNWRNPAVGDYFEGVLRFWFDKGVDGLRIDVAHALFKAAGLPDSPSVAHVVDGLRSNPLVSDQEEVHRDGARGPLPWTADAASNYGFSLVQSPANPWLPYPENWGTYAIELQQQDPHSTVHLVARVLELRRQL
jgi:glycosidase